MTSSCAIARARSTPGADYLDAEPAGAGAAHEPRAGSEVPPTTCWWARTCSSASPGQVRSRRPLCAGWHPTRSSSRWPTPFPRSSRRKSARRRGHGDRTLRLSQSDQQRARLPGRLPRRARRACQHDQRADEARRGESHRAESSARTNCTPTTSSRASSTVTSPTRSPKPSPTLPSPAAWPVVSDALPRTSTGLPRRAPRETFSAGPTSETVSERAGTRRYSAPESVELARVVRAYPCVCSARVG